jgi:hypothetical protein
VGGEAVPERVRANRVLDSCVSQLRCRHIRLYGLKSVVQRRDAASIVNPNHLRT